MNKNDSKDLVDMFTATLSSAQTRRAYRTDLRQFFGGTAGQDEIQELTANDIQGFLQSMHDLGRTVGTQRRQLAAMRSFFDWLISEGKHDRNPARHPDVGPLSLNEQPATARHLTAQELSAVGRAASGQTKTGLRDRALILTIVYGALRRSEVASLKVDDVRPLGRHWILDLDAASNGSGAYVRIPDQLVEILEHMKGAFKIQEGPLWRSVSNRSYGEQLSPSAIYRIVRDAGDRADVGTVSIDTLRRTGLHLAIQGGASLSQVQAHGRYGDSSSIAHLSARDAQAGSLSDSAVQYIDFDLESVVEPS
jgi:site-specific recombinase XerD